MGNFLGDFLGVMFTQSPFILVCVVGMILAVANWGKCPGPSMCALIGSMLSLGALVLGTLIRMYFYRNAASSLDMSPQMINNVSRAISFIQSLVEAAGFGLILIGVFSSRSKPRATYDEVDEVGR